MTDEQTLDEMAVIGAAMHNPDTADRLITMLTDQDFAEGKNRGIWSVIATLRDGDQPADYPAIAANLSDAGLLARFGGVPYLVQCSNALPIAADAAFHARRVAEHAATRRQKAAADRHTQILKIENPDLRAEQLAALGAELLAESDRRPGEPRPAEASLLYAGGDFLFEDSDKISALWGDGEDVLWAEGEALMLCGPSGVGKTTLANQIVRARLGLQDQVLGYSVQASKSKVLYLAMDRPQQWKRAARRLFSEQDYRQVLNEKLVVWKGPPPKDVAMHPEILLNLCNEAGADTIIVDSIKDAAVGVSKDEVGAGYNRARQMVLAAGIEIIELHHLRKANGENSKPNKLDDIYGSTWITAGAGSVVLLWGEPGDPVVEWRHLKQPENEIGPHNLYHDHQAGTSAFETRIDLFDLIRRNGTSGITAAEYATALYGATANAQKAKANKQKANRELTKKTDEGHLTVIADSSGTNRWFLRQG